MNEPRGNIFNPKGFLWIALFLIICLTPFPANPRTPSATVEVIHSRDKYPAGDSYPIIFRIRIKDSWYIHGPEKTQEFMLPTSLKFSPAPGIEVEKIDFPPPEKVKFDYSEDKIETYSGEILVRATLEVGTDAEPGETTLNGELSLQACSRTSCFPPESIPVSLRFKIIPEVGPSETTNKALFSDLPADTDGRKPWEQDAGFWLTLLGLFAGGLALNLTPCIYPLIPITVSYFGGRSGKVKGPIVLHGLFYIAGLSVTNSLLGVTASLSGGMLGSALQEPAVLIAAALVILGLGLSFFGLWEIKIPAGLVQASSKTFGGYFGTLFIGLTLGIVAAPCIGPFILGLLTYVGQTGDPFLGFFYFFVLSLGLGLPLAVLAVFSGTLEKLPVSGEWMVWIRKIFGWVLVGMAAYLVEPLTNEYIGSNILYSALLLAAGVHLGWLDKTGSSWRGFTHIKRTVGLLLIASAVVSLSGIQGKAEGIKWIPYREGILAEAQDKNKPVMLDFYAKWCLPCRKMDKELFSDPEVVALSKRFFTVRVDLTEKSQTKERARKEYNVKGVPTVVFLKGNGEEDKSLRIESHVSKEELMSRMKRLAGKNGT